MYEIEYCLHATTPAVASSRVTVNDIVVPSLEYTPESSVNEWCAQAIVPLAADDVLRLELDSSVLVFIEGGAGGAWLVVKRVA